MEHFDFGRKLGAVDQKTRNKGINMVQHWLSGGGERMLEDYLKIWRGLFFSMWHCDGEKVQLELSKRLAGLLHYIKTFDLSISFFESFLITITRDWHSIDRLRLDKFYLLIRSSLFECFLLLNNNGWNHSSITRFNQIIYNRVFLENEDIPWGIKSHFADIFLPELVKLQDQVSSIPPEAVKLLLDPFLRALSNTDNSPLKKRINSIFLQLSHGAFQEKFQLSCQWISERLTLLAQDKETLNSARENLYMLARSVSQKGDDTGESELSVKPQKTLHDFGFSKRNHKHTNWHQPKDSISPVSRRKKVESTDLRSILKPNDSMKEVSELPLPSIESIRTHIQKRRKKPRNNRGGKKRRRKI